MQPSSETLSTPNRSYASHFLRNQDWHGLRCRAPSTNGGGWIRLAKLYHLCLATAEPTPVSSLVDDVGNQISDELQIAAAFADNYARLYCTTPRPLPPDIASFVVDLPTIRLMLEERNSLEEAITFVELGDALGQLLLGKTPGLNRFPGEYFKAYWTQLGQEKVVMFLEALKIGRLLPDL
ncbi:hypothetical protein NDU88_002627 [Pleurodeles waltl]|uniref:Uncharacterized protein n=1 Tax=Pleurodeles waltl TaxID=8319 RepID=A0AAV7UZF2_PLEWA|nr:hypothetical protein NDU88_002627 [Pleurodeles waltl]